MPKTNEVRCYGERVVRNKYEMTPLEKKVKAVDFKMVIRENPKADIGKAK